MNKSLWTALMFLLLLPLVSSAEQRFNVPLGDAPQLGPRDAPVTIIEFLDFQ